MQSVSYSGCGSGKPVCRIAAVPSSRAVLAFLLPSVIGLVLLTGYFAEPFFETLPADTVRTASTDSVCGNGKVEAGEQCDDNNPTTYDGCAGCMVEKGFSCANEPSVCVRTSRTCGNGRVEHGESCDDKNRAGGDGCSGYCLVEAGFSCHGSPSACQAAKP
jgi:cysteine-rich repeat protein